MSNIQIENRQLTAELICQKISKSQLLPQLLRDIIINQTLSHWQPETPAQSIELEVAIDRYYQQIARLPVNRDISEGQLKNIAIRTVKLQQFKLGVWGNKLGSYYLNHKSQLDRVVYSIMQIEDGSIAQELFFRVQSCEQSFAKLAFKYSEGATALDGGKLIPIPFGSLHPIIASQIVSLNLGQLSPIFKIDNFYIFIRLEDVIPAKFDNRLCQSLLDELFERWLQERIASEIGSISAQFVS
jgi:PPIC-type PPIASE domain